MWVLETVAVAFGMYSALPVPRVEWTERNMRYALAAFPLIGAVQGLLWWGACLLSSGACASRASSRRSFVCSARRSHRRYSFGRICRHL